MGDEKAASCSLPNDAFRYNRDKLLSLRESSASQAKPNVNRRAPSYLFEPSPSVQPLLMPPFMRNQQNKPNQIGSPKNAYIDKRQTIHYLRPSTSEIMTKNNSNNLNTGTIHVSLSLNKDVKLNETKNAWKPSHLKRDATKSPEEIEQELYRKVRGILNKLTPENFDTLVEQILQLQIDTFEKVKGVMNLVFEKAVEEPNFSESYARLCKRLGDIKITGKSESDPKLNFRTALLNKTELEFKNNVLNREVKEKKLQPILEEMKQCSDPVKIAELKANFEEEERKIRRRLGGTVCFIGELFKNSMLTGNIINTCILNLLDPRSEDKLECLCKLLTTVGAKFEATVNLKDPRKIPYKLDGVIAKMQGIIDKRTEYKISSRIRFMLQDVIDLRRNKWVSTRKDSAPKTIEQINKDVEVEHLLNSEKSANRRDNERCDSRENLNISGGNFDRSGQRKRSEDCWQTQVGRRNKAVDTNKLGSLFSRSTNFDSDTKLGNSSQFMWTRFTSGAGKQQSPPLNTSVTNSFAALSIEFKKPQNRSPRKTNGAKRDFPERNRQEDIPPRFSASQSSRESSRSNSPSPLNTSASSYRNLNSPNGTAIKFIPSRLGEDSRGSSPIGSPVFNSRNSSRTSATCYLQSPQQNRMDSPIPSRPNPDDSMSGEHSQEPLTLQQNQAILRALDDMVEAAVDRKVEECITIVNQIPEKIRWGLVYNILCEYLHWRKTTPLARKMLAKAVLFLFKNNCVDLKEFKKGYKEFCELVSDIVIDVPNAWNYIFQFLGPLIHKKFLLVEELWNNTLKEADQGKNFVKELILYCVSEIGPGYTRELWRTSKFTWTDFMEQHEVHNFIEDNKFQFLENENARAPQPPSKRETNHIVERLKELLDDFCTLEEIFDYLDGNVTNASPDFIRSLTTTLCDFAIKGGKNSRLDCQRFQDICIPILLRCVDMNEERELACLYAIQQLDYVLEHPSGLLNEIFSELFDAGVIAVETFLKWRDSSEEKRGKGVAVKSLHSFFDSITNTEVSDGSDC